MFRWIRLTKLFKSLFKLGLQCNQPRDEKLIDVCVEGPQLIDRHRLKVLSLQIATDHVASFLAEKTVPAPLGVQVDGCRDRGYAQRLGLSALSAPKLMYYLAVFYHLIWLIRI